MAIYKFTFLGLDFIVIIIACTRINIYYTFVYSDLSCVAKYFSHFFLFNVD